MSSQTDALCRAIAGRLAGDLGSPVAFVDHVSWEERLQELDAGTVSMAWICGLPYVVLNGDRPARFELLAAPVMAQDRYAGRPVYFSDVVVRRESPPGNFDDLRGAVWAYNESGSFSGHVVVCAHLADRGAGRNFFKRWIATGSHLRSLELVLEGEADAAAIDSTVLDMAYAAEPGLQDRIRSVTALGPNPAPPWVISRELPRPVRERARASLCGLHHTPAGRALLETYRINCFAPVQDRDYDPIRETIRRADRLKP